MIEERERLASALRAIGLAPLPSQRELRLRPARGRARARRPRCCVRGSSCAPTTTGSGSRSATASDDDLIVETLARLLDRPAPVAAAAGRRVRHLRATAETRIAVRLGLDGASRVSVQTGAGIYDHFLEQLAFHAGLDLVVEGAGDLETGDHHTVEDTALAFGEALDRALGDRRGIARYGDAVVPMDDALARAAVDLGGRPVRGALARARARAGRSLLRAASPRPARMAIHVEATGRDAHHVAEAAYKAVGRALRAALRVESRSGIPSTKGLL